MKTIQKTLLAALCCTMALTAQAQERTFQRNKVLIEKHTGQGCVNCPAAEKVLEHYLSTTSNADNVVIMRHHNYPSSGNLRLSFHTDLSSDWSTNLGWPKMQADRYSFADDKSSSSSHYFEASSFSFYNIVDTRMQTPTYVSLSFDGSSYNPDTRKLRVTLSGEVTKKLPFLRINAFITQSGIVAYQNGGASGYVHDDISRAYLTKNVLGDELIPQADGTYSVTFETTLPTAYGQINIVPAQMKIVAFVDSYYDKQTGDCTASEVHNADAIALLDLPSQAPCALPTIELKNGAFVCKSTTPGAVCQYEVKPLMQPTSEREGSFDLEAPAFVVTAYANATGYATSSKVSRTFSLRDILGPDATNVRDVDGNGSVNKADIDALVSKLLKK